MQWNIHGNLGTATAQAGSGAAAIGRILNYLQPDLILLNEVADGSVETNTTSLNQWVAANLSYLSTFYVAVSTESSSIQRNAAISRYPILNPFTYDDVTTTLRGMHSFQLQLSGTNQLHVFHVHLKCCSDGSSCQEKQDEAQLFSDEMAQFAATNSTPYIFAGDLNEDELNPECVLSSTYHPVTMLLTNGGLAEFRPTTLSGEYRTWSTSPTTPSIRFDYILAETNVLSPISGFVFSTMDWAAHNLYTTSNPQNLSNDTRTASDHYSVVATYSFPTNNSQFQNIQTVFVIPLENQNWSSIKGNPSAPYINNTLLPMAAHAEQYFVPPGLHPSLPNYLWLEAGTNFSITSDLLPSSAHQSTPNHLVTLLKNAGISWRSYDEDICGCNCPLSNTNLYVPRHNPMVYFDDVTNTNSSNSASCIGNIRPYSQLTGDLSSNVIARYNWVVPNLCDDMHNNTGCSTTDPVKNGDTWLANNLPAILNSSAYNNNGAIFIVWDEGDNSSNDGPIGMIVLSPFAKAGYSNTTYYTHSSTLRTFQEIFGVGPPLGDASNAADLSDLFDFSTARFSISPATGLSSTGSVGGPFSPNNQTYTFTNIGTGSLSWAAAISANWLTLSATNGSLVSGMSTSVTVTINANANSLAANSYSDTLLFTNVSGGPGSTTRPISLTVNFPGGYLEATPASGLGSSGPPGGPFSPNSQVYTLSNSGTAILSWLATNNSNWLTLSPPSGSLSPGTTATLMASLNGNANSLAAGSYNDSISITNTSNGNGYITRPVSLSISSFGFFDDFSAFSTGALVGQNSWLQLGPISTLPLQVSGGQVVVPFAQSTDNQDAYKNFLVTNATVFYGVAVTVSNSPTGTPSYFAALWTGNDASGFANYRLTAKDNGTGTFVFGSRITGQTGDPYTYGSVSYSYGTTHRVILEADSGGTVLKLYVDPTSSSLGSQVAYLVNNIGTGTPPTSVGSFNISQFASGTAPNAGISIAKAVVADNFATVYNDLTPPSQTPFQIWQVQYFGSTNNPDAAPTADPDGDGMNNQAEFLAGTIPTNSASVFRINAIGVEGSDLRVTWTMGVGKTNILQRAVSLGLGNNSFTDAVPIITAGTVTNYLDSGAATNASTLFYRVRLGP